MTGLLTLLVPAFALDLEVTYTTTHAEGPEVTAPANPAVGYTRSWTFHDVDVTPPPDVLVECPNGQVCRLVTEVIPLGEDTVTIELALQTMEVGRREVRWEDVSTPRVTTRVGQPAAIEQGARIPVMVGDVVQFRHVAVRVDIVPVD